jgi:hypothetical protein
MAKNKYLSLDILPASYIEPLVVTSIATGNYNCIAWALEDTTHFYWTGPKEFFYWPEGISREESVESFIQLFLLHGFVVCPNALKEKGFTKIALFTKDGVPTHAARQLSNGLWTSKLGILEDVKHTLSAISGGLYGSVALVFKKSTPSV